MKFEKNLNSKHSLSIYSYFHYFECDETVGSFMILNLNYIVKRKLFLFLFNYFELKDFFNSFMI